MNNRMIAGCFITTAYFSSLTPENRMIVIEAMEQMIAEIETTDWGISDNYFENPQGLEVTMKMARAGDGYIVKTQLARKGQWHIESESLTIRNLPESVAQTVVSNPDRIRDIVDSRIMNAVHVDGLIYRGIVYRDGKAEEQPAYNHANGNSLIVMINIDEKWEGMELTVGEDGKITML